MGNKKKIYMSGGMSSFSKENFEESNYWRLQASAYMKVNHLNDVIMFNPNDHFNFAEDPPLYQSEREVMELDLYHLRSSDIVLHYANDPRSLGTMAELAIAYEDKKPIITVNPECKELHPWIVNFSNRIFIDLKEAVDYIIEHYIEV